MKVYISQVYVKTKVSFPFSTQFQVWLGNQLTSMVCTSPAFMKAYGNDFSLVFRMSAKSLIDRTEIKGPSVYPAEKNVEYTIFLPFDVIKCQTDDGIVSLRYALRLLLEAIISVFEKLGLEAPEILTRIDSLIEHVLSNSSMLDNEEQHQ